MHSAYNYNHLQYAELHCHSAFSFLDGASNPEELVARAKQLGLAALALTDHDEMGGVPRFAHAAKELMVQGIIGAELSLEDDSHLILLVKDLTGYKNLCALITLARSSCERGEPRLAYDDLFKHASGLLALSGCQHGSIPSALARGQGDVARRQLRRFLQVFEKDFFLEVSHHHLTQESILVREILEMAVSTSTPWVVTNNVHYATAAQRITHDVLTCLKHKVTLATAGRRLRPNGSYYLKSAAEMAELWRDDLTGIKNTLVVAERCPFRLGWLEPPLPAFAFDLEAARQCNITAVAPVDAPDPTKDVVLIKHDDGAYSRTALRYRDLLAELVWKGAKERYGDVLEERQIKQLNHELAMINRLQLAAYFLIMWDIVRFAASRGIAVQGRGSAANSAVCYCLRITAVDPIAMDLLFERFISEGRNEPPDIDLDIAHQDREHVLQYVYDKYGRLHAAMVSEVITYRGRSAVRDAARVLGFSQEQADSLAREAYHSEAREAARRLAAGGLEKLGFDPEDRRVKLLLKVIAGLHQLPRHRSIHVGGFVLSAYPIGEIVPVEPAAMHKRTVIQWDKDDIDLVGLIKIDLLGLGMLTMIQGALRLVKKHRGIDIDIGKLDMNDPLIYEMLQKAETMGLFQVESRAQMNILPRLKPTCFYDIIVSIAIVRPGPIQGNIIHPYLRRRRGEEPVSYLHPSIEPILKRTLGVPLFQEQGMRLAVTAANFTPSQADQLRKVMSHKRSKEKMARLCLDLAAGMRKNGFNEVAIATITHQLQAFANYGFPESHAASFSLLVYASAHLKKYYVPEFFCAILNAQPMGFYSPASLLRDAERLGLIIRPIDLAYSKWDCTLEAIEVAIENQNESGEKSGERNSKNLGSKYHLALRIGLRYIDGFGPHARAVLEASLHSGRFTSLEDVVTRSGLAPSELKVLAHAGAFDTFCPDRRKALWKILALLKPRSTPLLDYLLSAENRDADNRGSFDMDDSEPIVLPPMSELEELIADFRTMNLSTAKHPMSFYREWAKARRIYACSDLHQAEDGVDVTVAGGVICRQRPETAKGFVFLTLEDESGMANVVVKPKLFELYRNLIMTASFLKVEGRLQLEHGVSNIIARHIESLPALSQDLFMPSHDFH
ncbi:MAG: error-prone DNA polymerase [Cyanobacteria bacterium REEB67]|nr:error-prone DNA polymerase [Cyanobacteria bacterium REEB67]